VTSHPSSQTPPANVWVLASYRAGENSQLRALAFALAGERDLSFEIKTLVYRPAAAALGLLRWVGTAGIEQAKSSPLQAPWPSLVLTAGLRNEPLARWIRRQSNGRTRVVFIGRCWAPVRHFDLLVTTPQYRVRPRPQVLENDTTLQTIDDARLAAAAQRWAPRLTHLPSPRIALLIGGNSGPHRFGTRAAKALARRASALASELGGSLLVSTSSRTPGEVITVLQQTLKAPHVLYNWKPDDPDNPYFGYLGLADRIVVSSDSIAMLTEACASGKPVDIFDLSGRHPRHKGFRPDHDPRSLAYRALMFGPKRLTRDLEIFHQQLIDHGRAQWLGEPPSEHAPPPLDDMEQTIARIRPLLQISTLST